MEHCANGVSYSGTSIPSTQTYNTSKLLLLFKTDQYLNSQGFDASYTSNMAGMDENDGFKMFSVFPNPASSVLNIQFVSEDNETLMIQMTTISGQLVYDEVLTDFSGSFNRSVSTAELAKGVYLLRIIGEKRSVHRKIVIE